MSELREATARLREVARGRQGAADCEANPLVEANISAYGEGATFFVQWEVRPRDRANSVWLGEAVITPASAPRTDYIVQARQPDGVIPPNLALTGLSAHEDIPPGTPVRIFLIGNVKVGNDPFRYFCFEKNLVSGSG